MIYVLMVRDTISISIFFFVFAEKKNKVPEALGIKL